MLEQQACRAWNPSKNNSSRSRNEASVHTSSHGKQRRPSPSAPLMSLPALGLFKLRTEYQKQTSNCVKQEFPPSRLDWSPCAGVEVRGIQEKMKRTQLQRAQKLSHTPSKTELSMDGLRKPHRHVKNRECLCPHSCPGPRQ